MSSVTGMWLLATTQAAIMDFIDTKVLHKELRQLPTYEKRARFIYFSCLPAELRLKIWHFATPAFTILKPHQHPAFDTSDSRSNWASFQQCTLNYQFQHYCTPARSLGRNSCTKRAPLRTILPMRFWFVIILPGLKLSPGFFFSFRTRRHFRQRS